MALGAGPRIGSRTSSRPRGPLARVVKRRRPLVAPYRLVVQRKLRTVEEICCDDLVMSRLKAEPRTYAAAILTAIESLAIPTPRPPAMASNMSRGGSLERRMRRMIANHTVGAESRWLRRCVWVAAGLFLPVGVVSYAQDYEAVGKRLEAAVEADELSGPQARFMLAHSGSPRASNSRPRHVSRVRSMTPRKPK